MQKQLWLNGALVVLAVATAGIVWATRDVATTSELAARKSQLFPELVPDEVTRLTLSKGRERLVLEREAGEFRILEPWPERADVATIKKWLAAADMATVERPATDVSDARAGFGPGAFQAILSAGSKALKLTLGGPAPTPTGARYARVELDGRAVTSVVRGSVAAELELPFDDFRETRLLEYGVRELAKIELTSPAGKLELEQRAHGAFFVRVGERWELARPAALRALSEQLARLSSELFIEPEQARAALGPLPLRLKLEPKAAGAAPLTLSLGGACPKQAGLALLLREEPGRAPRAGCIDPAIVSALGLEPDALRLRGPFAAETDEVEELYIARGEQKLELARKDNAFVLRAPTRADVGLELGNRRIRAILGAEGELAASDVVGTGDGELRVQVAGGDEASHREERVLLGKPRPDKSVCFKRLTDGVVRCVTEPAARELEPDARRLRSLSLFAFSPSELTRLSVQTADFKELLLHQPGGGYELAEPRGFAYDAARVTDVVRELGTLEAQSWAASADDPAFGLAEPALRVGIQLSSSAERRELVVGSKLPGGGRYARISPDPSVFVLGGELFDTLSEPLIDRALCPFDEAELAQVELRVRGGAPREPEPKLREALVALRASAVRHLGAARADEGFEPPSLTVSYRAKDGKTARVLLGRCPVIDTPRCYARRDGVDATFTLLGDVAESLKNLIRP